ncbi:CopY/TcrY family copper transport repressor [Enterococcus termitis]|uniref:Penicillinase repressor n=1 Tax=Enterococcus termitis TaxID=332950 RepID=A0A1E5GD56_9ENTE|nr:CopY/TcrY family copper transport repressor [Enterococcus termitis]OEG10634.1 penicillinase repressor [Enterococcus termitis]OJG97897.1 CopY/TcrY family copper transport repressor [Enterococcus termitis]
MTTGEIQHITDAEWEVMRIVWTQGKTTSKEVQQFLNQKMDWKTTTIKTLLARLVEKNMLSTEKSGNKYIYQSLVEEKSSIQFETAELLEKICAKEVGAVLKTIIDDSLLSFDDIERLEEALEAKKEYAVDAVQCNCTPEQHS